VHFVHRRLLALHAFVLEEGHRLSLPTFADSQAQRYDTNALKWEKAVWAPDFFEGLFQPGRQILHGNSRFVLSYFSEF